MNLRNADEYNIGLDLGTGSVGWCVVDNDGELYHIKGKPTWGSRLFPSAETAANTRVKRGQRRRYDRRRERLDCLQSLFLDEMAEVDPEFFVRMRQSSLLAEDRDTTYDTSYAHPFFNGSDFTEADYYAKFPTIWHLRQYLMESDEPADVRLVYLALHNIVKCRGNFLHEGEGLSAANANSEDAALLVAEALEDYVEQAHEEYDESLSCEVDIVALKEALDQHGVARSTRAENIQKALGCSDKNMAKYIARACVGYKVEYANIFKGLEKQDGSSFELSNDEKVEEFTSLCPEEGLPLFEALQSAYSSYVLSDLLRGRDSLSAAMVDSYEQHQHDLKLLKGLVKDYLGMGVYNDLFRGPKDADGSYDINKLPKSSYTAYIAGEALANKKGCSQEAFVKNVRKLCEGSQELQQDERFLEIKPRLYSDNGEFLAKQKTRSNGAIPYQLHLEEMDRIIEKQGAYHPFLLENKELLEKLVSSRIPYYVGPLNGGHDPKDEGYPSNPIDKDPHGESENGRRKFAWSVRKPGMENVKAHPWNVDEVIDADETAERFIRRMTGTCSYLYGEEVLPRCSLIYEEYCVLNELNGARWAAPGEEPRRFDAADREALVEDLFKKRKTVSHKAVANWLERKRGIVGAKISGTQGESAFESKLNSYNDFCKLLGLDSLEDATSPLTKDDIEQIILWNTVFEDRDILKRKLQQKYGDVLTPEQINRIVKKRYTGWGRLSRKLLCGLKTKTPYGPMSIMDILREGDPRTGRHNQSMIFMEIFHEDDFGFERMVDEENKKKFGEGGNALTIDDLPGSPALRRSVNQAMLIIKEIVGIVGHDPKSIVIEVTRDEDPKKKGKRTTKRHDQLKEALEAYKQDVVDFDPSLLKDLEAKKDALNDDRLMLYFEQCGKCLYTGEPLDINRLSEYHIDHIIPQAYIKDDSLDNRALVKLESNESKSDLLLLPKDIVSSQRRWWGQLRDAGLMSDKKYRNLTRTKVSEEAMKGFINRQLVETSQVVKFVRQMCEQEYPGTEVISLRASLSHNLREKYDFVKCRELNDFHHAHDAYLACQMARFVEYRYPAWLDRSDVSVSIVRSYVGKLAEEGKKSGRWNTGKYGFIVDSFGRDGFDRETGEVFRDEWDSQREVAKIAHALDMKQCFISRMPEERSGAFWDETIYSPRDTGHDSDRLVPTKGSGTVRELKTSSYGGYNNPQQAYFFIFQARNKRGQYKYFFEGVPIHLVSRIEQNPEALTAYADSIANNVGCSEAQVLRSKVPYRQKFELEDTDFYLGARSNASNWLTPADEIMADKNISKAAYTALDKPEDLSQEEFSNLYLYLAAKLETACPKLAAALSLEPKLSNFDALNPEAKGKVIRNILGAAAGSTYGCNMSTIGGKKNSGVMAVALGSKIPRITWIDQSVTGIFEKRTTLEDMQKKLR